MKRLLLGQCQDAPFMAFIGARLTLGNPLNLPKYSQPA